jgi:hypothetical protein
MILDRVAGKEIPQGLKPAYFLRRLMYGLKPVPYARFGQAEAALKVPYAPKWNGLQRRLV